MRPLEIAIPLLLALYLAWPLSRSPRPVWVTLLPALALVVTLLHFWMEGYRWQMIPLYGLTPLLALAGLIGLIQPRAWTIPAAIQFCGSDPRCQAVLGLDPFMTPVSLDVLENRLDQPAFFMFSQAWADDADSKNNRLFRGFITQVPNSQGAVFIDGTRHYDFSDLPLLSPIAPQLGLKGPLNGKQVVKIVDTYLLAFFNAALQGQPSDLFHGDFGAFEEVHPMK
jgi:hypothetical protein